MDHFKIINITSRSTCVTVLYVDPQKELHLQYQHFITNFYAKGHSIELYHGIF